MRTSSHVLTFCRSQQQDEEGGAWNGTIHAITKANARTTKSVLDRVDEVDKKIDAEIKVSASHQQEMLGVLTLLIDNSTFWLLAFAVSAVRLNSDSTLIQSSWSNLLN